MAVALALGLGTMIGWKRIVVTVGERIGTADLTYAQGASAEIVAGTMVGSGSGVQGDAMRNIILACVLTLPVCVLLGAGLFGAALPVVFRVLGMH